MITGDERSPGGSRPPEKDSSDAFMTIARDNVVTADGFGLISGRHRRPALRPAAPQQPAALGRARAPGRSSGIGIDESTALEVGPSGPWRVLGESVAVVYDAREAAITPPRPPTLGATGVRLSVLPAGQHLRPVHGCGDATVNRRESSEMPR